MRLHRAGRQKPTHAAIANRDAVVMAVELWLEMQMGSALERQEARKRYTDFMNSFDKIARQRVADYSRRILATRPGNAKRIRFEGDSYQWS